MKYFGITDKGKIRKDNQDSFSIKSCQNKNAIIVALCDGMGGARAGGLASDIVNNTFVEYISSRLSSRVVKNPNLHFLLQNGCIEANAVAFDCSQFDDALNGMGTTIVGGVIFNNGHVCLINVGDSRAYHISKRRRKIRQITCDHSLVADLVRAGVITRDEAKTHPQRNVITRAIGSEKSVESDYYEFSMSKGDMILFCSDGLSNYVDDVEMLDYFFVNKNPEIFCRTMLDITYERGAGDNITIVAVVYE